VFDIEQNCVLYLVGEGVFDIENTPLPTRYRKHYCSVSNTLFYLPDSLYRCM